MKYYFVVGELSGDLHASYYMKHIKYKDCTADFRYIGGPNMYKESKNIFMTYDFLSVMGVSPLNNLFFFIKKMRKCYKDILKYHPHYVVLVDSGGFNLVLAHFLYKKNIKIIYFIPPKTWAWGKFRNFFLKKYCYHIYIIFDFEYEYFKNEKFDNVSKFPIFHAIKRKNNKSKEYKTIALFLGSRIQEIKYVTSVIIQLLEYFNSKLNFLIDNQRYEFIIAGLSNIDCNLYKPFLKYKNVSITYDDSRYTLSKSDAAIVVSGTASLEAYLLKVPHVVIYKTSDKFYKMVKNITNLKYISMVNIIANHKYIKELIQDDCNLDNLITFIKNYEKINMNYQVQI